MTGHFLAAIYNAGEIRYKETTVPINHSPTNQYPGICLLLNYETIPTVSLIPPQISSLSFLGSLPRIAWFSRTYGRSEAASCSLVFYLRPILVNFPRLWVEILTRCYLANFAIFRHISISFTNYKTIFDYAVYSISKRPISAIPKAPIRIDVDRRKYINLDTVT